MSVDLGPRFAQWGLPVLARAAGGALPYVYLRAYTNDAAWIEPAGEENR